MKITFLIIIFFNLAACFSLHASPFKEITIDEGLSNRRVLESVKDIDGYIWFATRSGIDKYNGDSFNHYKLKKNDSEFIENPRGIHIDKDGIIYAYSDKHIYYYLYQTDSFHLLSNAIITPKESINTLSTDPAGQLWIGTTEHLYRYDLKDKQPKIIKENISVFNILFNNDLQGWISTSRGVRQLIGDEGKSYTISKNKNLSDLDDKRIQTLYYDSLTNHLWIGTFSNGLYVYDSEKKELNNINPGHHPHPIRNITNINTNRVWVAIDGGGIKEYNRFTCEYEKEYTQDSNDQNHISVNSIYHLLNNGNSVWICTYTGGVLVYNKSKLINNIFSHIQNNIHSLRNSHVNCLLEDKKGRIWFGTNKGISRFNPQNNEWKHFLQNSSTGNSVILSLYQDNDDNVWAGGYACDVIYIDNNDKIHYIDEFVSKNERQKYIYALNGDSKGNIWMGGIINELMRFSPVTKKIEKVQLKGINQIVNYNQDTLLLATSKGLMFLDINTNHYSSPITKDSLNPIKAITQSITFMPKDPQNIWIATEGQGIICYNLKTQELQQFTKSNGLSSNNICGIQYDNHGRIWASSENGINCIYPNLKRIDVFYEQDGLPTNTLNFRSHMKTNNGNIFWGTSAGAFELAPSEFIQKSKQVYNLRFIEFALFNKPIQPAIEGSPLSNNIDRVDEISLSHYQHSFSLKFLNLGYLNASKNLYSWFLEGFDNEWTSPSNQHHAVYTNIPPGNYIFHVKVFTGGDDNDYQERVIKIIIMHPWWKSWYAWCFYILLSITIIYFLLKAYKDNLDSRDSEQKIRFFVNMAHDIRTPLTLIKAPLNEISDESLSDNGKTALMLAQRNTEKLLNMVTQLLDFQKVEREAMSLQVEETQINLYLNSIISNFEPLAREKQIIIHITPLDKESIGYIDQRKISIILDNLLSNSIKYTCQHGNVWVKFYLNDEYLEIEITDDGIGISPQAQKKLFNRFYRAENAINSKETGSGIGLLLTKKMVHLHKGNISFSSNEGIGTNFHVRIPIGQSYYSKTEIIEKNFSHNPEINIEENKEANNKLKLLIVEDNEELRSYLTRYMSIDYAIVESPDGQHALDIVSKENPDFIISDVMMPHISGIDLCQKLKTNIETCHIPIILLTSLAERENIIKGLNAGADDYITKPFDLTVLKSKIGAIISNRQLYRKKYIDKSAFNDESRIANDLDKTFMIKVVDYIEEKMMNEDFSIDNLAMEMAMSRSVFFKKIKSLTGQNPLEFIRDIKMKKAALLITEKKYNIGEVAYLTGYPNAKYFSTAFKKYYGKSPTDYLNTIIEQVTKQ